ncbi:phosphoribosyltransferase family protein [Dactylosporangium sp. NPDC005555]|uniref:phosphoribosyltransferase n=1 Tax=Dactylosporangium sp. NPDC005555 TaxID=3154889 RepID=UPI0033BE00C9
MDEREELGWQEFGDASRVLAQRVADDGFRPDVVLAVARGGLLLAGALGYALDVKSVVMMNVLYYTGVEERLDAPVVLRPTPDGADLAGARVLIADDVADTGATLRVVRDFCLAHAADVRIAVLYEKPATAVRCRYVWRRTDRWINFPWSAEPPVAPRSQ